MMRYLAFLDRRLAGACSKDAEQDRAAAQAGADVVAALGRHCSALRTLCLESYAPAPALEGAPDLGELAVLTSLESLQLTFAAPGRRAALIAKPFSASLNPPQADGLGLFATLQARTWSCRRACSQDCIQAGRMMVPRVHYKVVWSRHTQTR